VDLSGWACAPRSTCVVRWLFVNAQDNGNGEGIHDDKHEVTHTMDCRVWVYEGRVFMRAMDHAQGPRTRCNW
jgi:hypothetical protein